jgi:Uncharacterized conserved protein
MTLSFTTHWRDQLPDFYTSLAPTPLNNARLIWRNAALAKTLGVADALFEPAHGAGVWGGEALLPGMSPLAQVYSGHQFGAWAGQLGDGRGILLGEQQLPDGQRFDWHLKGAGLTPYSRMGDRPGGAALNDPRKSCFRSDVRIGHPNDSRAGDGDQRHAGLSRKRRTRDDADAYRGKSRALRPL